jgi:hypothetical protein
MSPFNFSRTKLPISSFSRGVAEKHRCGRTSQSLLIGEAGLDRLLAIQDERAMAQRAWAIALFTFYYNFVRIHQTLKVTPAMAVGVSDRLWEMGDIAWPPMGRGLQRCLRIGRLPRERDTPASKRPWCCLLHHDVFLARPPKPSSMGQDTFATIKLTH